MGSLLEVSWCTTRHHIHPHHISPFLFPQTLAGPWHVSVFCLDPLSSSCVRSGSVSDRSCRPIPERPLPSRRLPSWELSGGALSGGRKLGAKAICLSIRRR